MKLLAAALAMLICASAHGAGGLAVISTSGAKAGDLVKAETSTAWKYATPKPTDLVRVGNDWGDFVWLPSGSVKIGQKVEACQTSLTDPTIPPNRDDWTPAKDLCKSWQPVARTFGFEATVTPGKWVLKAGTTTKGSYDSEALCVAQAAALSLARAYTCATTTGVAVKLVTGPVVPPVIPPVIPPGGKAMKFNPGFGVRPDNLGYSYNSADRRDAFMQVCNDTNISLLLISVPWGSIEPKEGVYDFAPIDSDLAVAKQCGKRLIIEPWYQKYGQPSDDGRDTRHFPQYIIDGGGVARMANGENHVKINEARWAERFYELYKALAARYDTDPNVEQVVITETASTSSPGSDSKYLLAFAPRVQALFKQTVVVAYPNWVDTPEQARDLLTILAANGMGVGAPDIIGPPGMNYEDHSSKALRGVGVSSYWGGVIPRAGEETGDFGRVDYRGKLVVSYQFQGMNTVGADRIIDYAINELRATHLIFSMIGDYGGQANWARTRDVIAANANRINRTRPALLK